MIDFIWKCLKSILFLLDAERAHHLILTILKCMGSLGPRPLQYVSGYVEEKAIPTRVFGMSFRSRVGLAAGFDKNGELLQFLPSLGFGFAEVGTVTPRPQPGNPQPRLFRDVKREFLFNRMGFNNDGAEAIAERVARARDKLPSDFRIGINVGKNFDTPLDRAAQDYSLAAAPFAGIADYLVVNVSSPNTEGLRSLQESQALAQLVGSVRKEVASWQKSVPVLVKLMPELQSEDLKALCHRLEPEGVDGWILTNTLGGEHNGLHGGWSGRILTETSRNKLTEMRSISKLPIISVGGIYDAIEAAQRFNCGAQLIQIYSGWIFQGPRLPAQLGQAITT